MTTETSTVRPGYRDRMSERIGTYLSSSKYPTEVPPPVPLKDLYKVQNLSPRRVSDESSHASPNGDKFSLSTQPNTSSQPVTGPIEKADGLLPDSYPLHESALRDSKKNVLEKLKVRMETLKTYSVIDARGVEVPLHGSPESEDYTNRGPYLLKKEEGHSRSRTEPTIPKQEKASPIRLTDDAGIRGQSYEVDYRGSDDPLYGQPPLPQRAQHQKKESRIRKTITAIFSTSTPNLHKYKEKRRNKPDKGHEDKIAANEVIRLQREEALRACGLLGTSVSQSNRQAATDGAMGMSAADMIKQDWIDKNLRR